MIFAWFNGILSVLAIVTDRTFTEFITTIGAASAIIILVFRDTILGFVASIQVSINDMVHIGDWVTFEKYGAGGGGYRSSSPQRLSRGTVRFRMLSVAGVFCDTRVVAKVTSA